MKGYQLFINFLHSKGYKVDTSSELATFEYNNGHVAFLGGEDDVVSIVFKYVFQEEIDQNLYEELCDEMNAKYNGAVRFSISSNSQNLFIEHPFYCTEGCNELVHFEEVLNLIMELKEEFKERLQTSQTENDANTLIESGLKILLGSDDSKTDKEAVEIFKAAEQLNHFCANDALNIVNINRNERKSYINLLAGAYYNDINCSYTLGCAYEQGEGLPQSYEDAARWYRVAAEQGHAEAQCNLGYLHANGLGVEESQEEAFHWYKQAADNGDMTALANLITYYWTGRVVPTSYEKAREIIKTVFEKEPSAMEPISNFFNNCIAEMIQKGVKEETALINQASLGNYVAIEALGILYANQENYSKAYLKFKEGAELGLPHSQYALAMLYLDGLGIKENINNALLWLNKSVSQHYAPAQFQLGGHYLLGDIVKQDRNKGLNLIKLAAENGHEEAISLLESYGL